MEKLNMNKKLPLRLLGALLAVLLVLAVFPISALAAENMKLAVAVDKASVIEGDEVKVTVSITDNPGVASVCLDIGYNEDVFELKSNSAKIASNFENEMGSLELVDSERFSFGIINTEIDGTVLFNWIYNGALDLQDPKDCNFEGGFAQIVLVAKTDATTGDYEITVTPDTDNITRVDDATVIVTGELTKTVTVLESYTVTYNANGGTGEPSAQTKTKDIALKLSSTVPTKTGYTFKHWQATDGTTYAPGATYSEDKALTLFAVWQRNASTLAVENSVGVAGGTVIVPVTIGTADMSATSVELTVTAKDLTFNGAYGWEQNGDKISKTFNPAEVFQNGSELVNLKFKIPQDAEVNAEYTVSIKANIDDDFETTITKTGAVKVVDYILGDVNGDGYVNSKDASLVLRYDARLIDTINTVAGDVNGDGLTNSKDASLILRFDAHLITEFPKNNN